MSYTSQIQDAKEQLNVAWRKVCWADIVKDQFSQRTMMPYMDHFDECINGYGNYYGVRYLEERMKTHLEEMNKI